MRSSISSSISVAAPEPKQYRLSNNLARFFWIPAATLVAVEIYAGQFDGWGAWATATLFLLPLILSVVIASAGLVKCIVELRKGSPYVLYMVFTVVAALPLLWLIFRRQIV